MDGCSITCHFQLSSQERVQSRVKSRDERWHSLSGRAWTGCSSGPRCSRWTPGSSSPRRYPSSTRSRKSPAPVACHHHLVPMEGRATGYCRVGDGVQQLHIPRAGLGVRPGQAHGRHPILQGHGTPLPGPPCLFQPPYSPAPCFSSSCSPRARTCAPRAAPAWRVRGPLARGLARVVWMGIAAYCARTGLPVYANVLHPKTTGLCHLIKTMRQCEL